MSIMNIFKTTCELYVCIVIWNVLSTLEADIIENVGGNLKSCLWLNNDQNIVSGGEENVIRYTLRIFST